MEVEWVPASGLNVPIWFPGATDTLKVLIDREVLFILNLWFYASDQRQTRF